MGHLYPLLVEHAWGRAGWEECFDIEELSLLFICESLFMA